MCSVDLYSTDTNNFPNDFSEDYSSYECLEWEYEEKGEHVFLETNLANINNIKASLPLAKPLPPANLLLDISTNTNTPGTSEEVCFKIKYRCASITEHCFNSEISFTLPPSMTITSAPTTGGNITNLSTGGNTFILQLASPPNAGAPAGALAAGSAGLIKVCAKFKCATEAAPSVAGDVVNFDASFSVNGGATTAISPNVTVPTLDECAPYIPPSPPGGFSKGNHTLNFYHLGFPGSFVGWKFYIPTHTAPFAILDTMPTGILLSDFDQLDAGYSLDVNCGTGFHTIAIGGGADELQDDVLALLNPGDNIPDINGNPTDCIVEFWDAVDGTSLGYISNMTSFRLNVPANDMDGAIYKFVAYVDEDVSCDDYQNVAHTDIPNEFPVSADYYSIYCTGIDVRLSGGCTGEIGDGLTIDSDFDQVNPFLNVDPLDMQFRIQVANGPQATEDVTQGFVVEALLDEGLSFNMDPGNPNYWAIHQSPNQVQPNPNCYDATFVQIPNYTGNQTLLRWTFPPSCILPAGYTNNLDNYFSGTNQFPEIYFSVRYDLSVPIASDMGFTGTFYLSDNSVFRDDKTSINLTYECITPSGISMNSSKYVKGAFDQSFQRFPDFGSTNLNGDGDYELFIYQNGFDGVRDINMVEILPYIGDIDLLNNNIPRESEWSLELCQGITVERYKIGAGLIDASPQLGNGIYYSTSINPCYLTSGSNVSIAGPSGNSGGVCDGLSTANTPVGARSLGFHWSDPIDPLVFGEYLKITLKAKQLNGEADKENLEIAWNSFIYSSVNLEGDTLTSQPIKVGLRMIDETAFASLGDYVWKDANGNGIQDIDEEGVAGASLSIYHLDGTPVSDTTVINSNTVVVPITATTDSLGEYCFIGLEPNQDYIIRLDNPVDYIGSGPLAIFDLSTPNIGNNEETDSDAVFGNGNGLFATEYPEILMASTLEGGEKVESYDFGFYQPATICGHAWLDKNKEGNEENSEPDVENVIVVAKTLDGIEVTRDTTDSEGYYNIYVPPGSYNLCIDTSLVSGYIYTVANASTDDLSDSDVNSEGIIGPITVAECGDISCDQDIGFRLPIENPAAIKGVVWDELDKNSIRDTNEEGIVGITVYLLDDLGFVITSTTTDIDGSYGFSNLEPNMTYAVSFSPGLDSPFTPIQNNGSDDTIDSDADPTTGTTDGIIPAENECVENVDAGLCAPYSIGNLVWEDLDNNGMFDSGEGVFGGITVYLYDPINMTYLDTTVTDANGKYVFTGLQPGDYVVEVEVPTGYTSSTDITGTNTPNTSDNDDNGNGVANAGTVLSNTITLVAGAGNSGDPNWTEADHSQPINGSLDNTTNPKAYYTVDFGFHFIPPCFVESNLTYTLPTCNGGTNNNDGSIIVLVGTAGTHYGISSLNATIYNGPTNIVSANALSGTFPETIFIAGFNTGGSYIVRIFDELDSCYVDQTITFSSVACCPSPEANCLGIEIIQIEE